MKGLIKFLKNVLWTFVLLGILGIVGGICYGFYDYYNGNTEKYQQLYTQALSWVMNLKNKVTGEETEIVEVSPTQMPTMELSVVGTRWEDINGNRNCVAYDEQEKPIIFVYGKDIGGDLIIPYGLSQRESIKIANLYTGNEWEMPEITEHIVHDPVNGTAIVAEDYLMSLEPGEYYLSIEPVNEDGNPVGLHYVPLIVTETTTYISPQQGFAGSGDKGMILNDLQNIQEIIMPFYNLGDDRIVKLRELSTVIGDQNLVFPIAPENYEIVPAGNAVVLTKEYLQNRPEFAMQRFQVVLASGATLDTGWTYITTVNGEVDWLTVDGPDVYSLTHGGDYIADIHMGWAQRFDAFHLIDLETGHFVVDERDNGTGDFPSIDEENKRVVIPESVMKTLGVGREYNVVVKYQNGGTGFLGGEKRIRIQK